MRALAASAFDGGSFTCRQQASIVFGRTRSCIPNGSGGDLILKSVSPENYLLAHFLFKAALAGGMESARTLIAASIDRYLGFTEGRQLYGTKGVIDQATGKELLVPIDRTISDKERATFGVPPLAELLEKWAEQKDE